MSLMGHFEKTGPPFRTEDVAEYYESVEDYDAVLMSHCPPGDITARSLENRALENPGLHKPDLYKPDLYKKDLYKKEPGNHVSGDPA